MTKKMAGLTPQEFDRLINARRRREGGIDKRGNILEPRTVIHSDDPDDPDPYYSPDPDDDGYSPAPVSSGYGSSYDDDDDS